MTTSNEHNNAPAVPQDRIDKAKRAVKDLADEAQANGNSETWVSAQDRLILSVIDAATPAPAPAVPDGLQWFTVAEHGIPEVGAEVIGGLWYTDPWLKPEFATTFMWGQCRVVESKHRDFKDGKQWHTFGPSHNQITHWARINNPGQAATPAPAPAQEVDEAQIQKLRENGAKAWAGVDAQQLRAGFAAPSQEPADVTLTDEEIEELQWRVPAARNSTADDIQIRTTRQMTLFARAIIAALRAKGGK